VWIVVFGVAAGVNIFNVAGCAARWKIYFRISLIILEVAWLFRHAGNAAPFFVRAISAAILSIHD
jgi:hypothetical protein